MENSDSAITSNKILSLGKQITIRPYTRFIHFSTVQNLLENLIYTLLYNTHNKRNMNQLTMGLLFLNLMSLTDKLVSKDKGEQNAVNILSYIEENYKNGSLKELSKKCTMILALYRGK